MRQERDRQAGAAAVVEARRRLAAGDAQGAFRALRACAVEHPTYAPAYVEAARLLLSRGDRGGATQLLSDALGRVDEAGRGVIAGALAGLLADIRVTGWHPRLEADVIACLVEAGVDAQLLSRTAADLLLAKYTKADEVDLADLGGDPLALAFLSRCLNVQPEMEVWLVAVRARLVQQANGGHLSDAMRTLTCAMALQAFAAEYLAAPVAMEADAVERLRSAGDGTGAALMAALSQPLIGLGHLGLEAGEVSEVGDGLGAMLLKRTLDDLQLERALAETMLGPDGVGSEDQISAKVRLQYEENPYPRWLTAPVAERGKLSTALAAMAAFDGRPPDLRRILIAGCGTGYEAIDIARCQPGSPGRRRGPEPRQPGLWAADGGRTGRRQCVVSAGRHSGSDGD